MTKNHLKARSAPRTWNIARKDNTFITRPNPGSQSLEMTLPLDAVLRTIGVGQTKKELNYILRKTPVLVNGTRRYDLRFGIGFMDVVSIPETKQYTVLSMDSHGRLAPEAVTEKLAGQKLVQVRSLSTVAGGKLQLHLTDGQNLIVTAKDAKNYVRGATVVVSIPKTGIVSVHPVAAKADVILTAGKHRGSRGTIETIEGEFVTVTTPKGSISTKKNYAFVLVASAAGGASGGSE